ncbi:MAG: enolase C-terminal domain-like protein [Pseudomonadota bacterium]
MIEQLILRRLKLPLKTPYRLAFAELVCFETLLIEARDEDGRKGFGEATYLPGYGSESLDDAWSIAQQIAPHLVNRRPDAARRAAALHLAGRPFTATAFVTAFEMLEDHPLLGPKAPARIPLLAGLNGTGEQEIEARLAEGYRTLKVKVGFDPDEDLKRVRQIQRRVAGRAELRLDANQGWTRDQALGFVGALDPAGIELLEQPCPAGDWEAAAAVAQAAPLPLMLDESIYRPSDIERAAQLGAAGMIKLKLMKLGGLEALAAALERIAELGMTAVLGNGVAGELGCWMEAAVARDRLAAAGEMNGFLRARMGLFATPLKVERGQLLLPADRPRVDPNRLADTCEAAAVFPSHAAVSVSIERICTDSVPTRS